MFKTKERIISVFLTIILVSGLMPFVVFADVSVDATINASLIKEDIIDEKKNIFDVKAYIAAKGATTKASGDGTDIYNPFTDVKSSASYFKYLMWAYYNGVIKGTSDTTFDPNGNCKRCDLAVMLYRMYGKPNISGLSIPFKDVKSSDYYYSAVVWAYNKGYIKGTSSTKFNPKGSITRQDMVVILWRMNGSEKVEQKNPFTDVPESSYAYKAIMWAYKNKITSGTSSTKFSPKANCLRYQLAVFLNKFNNIVQAIPEEQSAHIETTGEHNALSSAKTYLNYSAFSYTGLIKQLEYEGFSSSEAEYGADNCGADWYEQAVREANSYLNYSAFSYTGLIEQLEYEGFTSSEAEYGADNCGADWYEQAVKEAKSYLDYSAFSYTGLVDQLEYEGYSTAQAKYAADNCGADWYEQAVRKAREYLGYYSFSRDQLVQQLKYEGFTSDQAEYAANVVL